MMIDQRVIDYIRARASVDALKWCLGEAIGDFNLLDAGTLLCPGRKDLESVVRGHARWGAANERAVAHRLAVYIEKYLARLEILSDDLPLRVDCEYNRHRDGSKDEIINRDIESVVKIVEAAGRKVRIDLTDPDALPYFSVCPDIVVHARGNDDLNLLVIEMKKKYLCDDRLQKYDSEKLKGFTHTPWRRDHDEDGYGYALGAAVTVTDDVAPDDRKLSEPEWYLNGDKA